MELKSMNLSSHSRKQKRYLCQGQLNLNRGQFFTFYTTSFLLLQNHPSLLTHGNTVTTYEQKED